MARRRKPSIPESRPSPPSPSSPSLQRVTRLKTQMRGLIEAARAPRARRFVTPTQVQARINALYRQEVSREKAHVLRGGHDGKRSQAAVFSDGVYHRLPDRPAQLFGKLSKQVRDVFHSAERALECVKRETRRQVMFAMRRTGKGGRGNRKARWTAKSRISCKRS